MSVFIAVKGPSCLSVFIFTTTVAAVKHLPVLHYSKVLDEMLRRITQSRLRSNCSFTHNVDLERFSYIDNFVISSQYYTLWAVVGTFSESQQHSGFGETGNSIYHVYTSIRTGRTEQTVHT